MSRNGNYFRGGCASEHNAEEIRNKNSTTNNNNNINNNNDMCV